MTKLLGIFLPIKSILIFLLYTSGFNSNDTILTLETSCFSSVFKISTNVLPVSIISSIIIMFL